MNSVRNRGRRFKNMFKDKGQFLLSILILGTGQHLSASYFVRNEQ